MCCTAGLPNPWPAGHIWPVKLFCVAWPASFFSLVDFLMKKFTIWWQIKRRSKPKPSFVWFSRNRFKFAAKAFFCLIFTCFWGQISVILVEINTDSRRRTFFFILSFTYFWGRLLVILAEINTDLRRGLFFRLNLPLGTDYRNTDRSEHRFCTTNLQLFEV